MEKAVFFLNNFRRNSFLFYLIFLLIVPTIINANDNQDEKTYKRAVEGADNVKHKLFPKSNKIELSLPHFGKILNQSYLDSYAVHGEITYFFKEDWGFSLGLLAAINSDKPERYCVERFINDFLDQIPASCPAEGESNLAPLFDSNGNRIRGANYGPAYPAIREIGTILSASANWSPIYGKQLIFGSSVIYFDFFFTFGLGITSSTYYPKSSTLRNGKTSRGVPTKSLPKGGCPSGDGIPGVCESDKNFDSLIGSNGRPDPSQEKTPTLLFGLGQKIHFLNRWHFQGEVRSYTLAPTPSGIEPFYMLWAGIGVRI